MGKASRAKRERDPESRARLETERAIDAYLSTTGARAPATADQYWNGLEASHGVAFVEDLITLLNQRGEGHRDPAIYDLIYRDRSTTRATYPLTAPMARAWLAQFATMALPTGSVLDLGCGSGLFTCWYAKQRPADVVVGVDISSAAIARAREVAQSLNVSNVEFIEHDVAQLNLNRHFPLVVSTLALVDIDNLPNEYRGFTTTTQAELAMEGATSRLAEIASAHLAAEGSYVSVERLPGFPEHAFWVGALGAANLRADLSASTTIDWDNAISGRERVPVIVARSAGTHLTLDRLAAWYAARPADDWGHNDFLEERSLVDDEQITFVAGEEFEVFDEHGEGFVRTYFMVTSEGYALYTTTSRGYRGVEARSPASDRQLLADAFAERCSALRSAPDVVRTTPLSPADFAVDLRRIQ